LDTPLKQRLIGAAVLIALAVFFLPMLVKGPAPDSGVSDVSTDIPDGPEGATQTRDLPLVAPGDVPKGGAVGMDATPVDRPAADAPSLTASTGDPDTATDSASATPTDPAAATDPTAAAALPATAAGGNYAVHFGAYATQKNAETVAALAKKSQLPAYSEPATVGGKAAWRVRIGPYASRADAEAARLKALDVRSDVPVRVVVLDADSSPAAPAAPTPEPPAVEAPKPVAKPSEPVETKPADTKPVAAKPTVVNPTVAKPAVAKPAAPKPSEPVSVPKPTASKPADIKPATPKPPTATAASASTPATVAAAKPAAPKPAATKPAESGPLVAVAPKPKPTAAAKVGFAVQLGAFSAAGDATALRDRLRASGFAAFTETVSTDKGPLTRVRVGPVIDRAAADQLKAQVKAKTGVDGLVRPHP